MKREAIEEFYVGSELVRFVFKTAHGLLCGSRLDKGEGCRGTACWEAPEVGQAVMAA